ncbi:MAG TPA: xanthine dehydrogenase family protein molybdopterin-binding subunit, partial [Stellaceae bacterium]
MATNTADRERWRGRIEDEALLRGRGRFAADARDPDQAYACFVRSPHAFARIRGVDIGEAQRAPGVLAVLTAADMAGVGSISRAVPQKGRDGAPLKVPHRPALAGERALHAGEPVALVVAETSVAAQDAAELVDVAYDELSPAVDLRAAAAADAPQLHPEAPSNVAIDWALGGEPETQRALDEAFRNATHVARVSLVNQRIVVASM